ncbi:MAG TPA: matrixin family metalloprotease [Pyrinomonadaceae bacterium]|nr:matrixin family metalloprotease [Pyrinomonadaceae bacterium]
MKNLHLGLLAFIILLGNFISIVAQTTDIYSCVTDLVIDEKPKRPGISRAVFQPSKKWVPGQEIRVKFLDGDQLVRNKVMEYAEVWEEYANIDFVFVESGPAEIRISFTIDKGSWSYFGKDSAIQSMVKTANGPQFVRNNTGASMNFGWFNDNTPEQEFRRTTLHEFGHALGLHHEHKNTNADFEWNEEAVYAYFAKQGWSREKVQSQVLERYGNNNVVTNGEYDPLSIMHYYFPPELVKDGRKLPANTVLSENDKRIIEEMYPFDDDDTAKVTKPTVNTPTTNKPVAPPVVQPIGPIFSFTDSSVDFEGLDEKTDQEGMVFTSDFTVKNGLKQEFTMAIYFYTANGTPLADSNKKFYTANGKVAVFKKFTPNYDNAVYKEFEMFMPYEELELENCGKQNLKYSIGIWSGQKRVMTTGFTYFSLDVPCE